MVSDLGSDTGAPNVLLNGLGEAVNTGRRSG